MTEHAAATAMTPTALAAIRSLFRLSAASCGAAASLVVTLMQLPWTSCCADLRCTQTRSPKNPQQKIIKRVIGLEGDFIRTLSYKNRYVRIPDGHFWIEGDHHGHSLDSNSFGPVSVGLLHGRASHIIWPPKRWQRIKASLPPNRGPVDIKEEEG